MSDRALELLELRMSIAWWKIALAAALVAGLCPLAPAQSQPQPKDQPDTQTPKPPTTPPVIEPETPPGKSLVKVGDAAPQLKVLSWIKGDPIKDYDRGKVYVVELWATWCAPCKESIPHLTQLQHDYKDKGVRIVGVSIWENSPPYTLGGLAPDATPEQVNAAYLERVKTYAQGMGDKMDYTVAFDGIEGTTADWMFRLAQSGIPCAYVINREGRMAWIGHPEAIDKPLAEIVAGTYDLAGAPGRIAKDAAKERKIRNLEAKYRAAQASDDKAAQLAVIDEFVDLSPEEFQKEVAQKFRMMLIDMKDEKGAYAYARKVSQGAVKNLYEPLNDMAWTILDDDGVANRDYDLALALALQADEAAKHQVPTILDTLARAYFEKGDIDRAVETETKAIALLKDDPSDARLKPDLEAALKKYKGAKK